MSSRANRDKIARTSANSQLSWIDTKIEIILSVVSLTSLGFFDFCTCTNRLAGVSAKSALAINRRHEGRTGEENRLVFFLPSPSKNLRRKRERSVESTRPVDRKKRQKSRRHTSLTHKICFVRGGSRLRHRRRKAFLPPIFRPNEPGRSGGVQSYARSKDIASRHECRSRKKDRQIGESGN